MSAPCENGIFDRIFTKPLAGSSELAFAKLEKQAMVITAHKKECLIRWTFLIFKTPAIEAPYSKDLPASPVKIFDR
jgi:hypothetical protein